MGHPALANLLEVDLFAGGDHELEDGEGGDVGEAGDDEDAGVGVVGLEDEADDVGGDHAADCSAESGDADDGCYGGAGENV